MVDEYAVVVRQVVIWSYVVEADSTEEAARKAAELHRPDNEPIEQYTEAMSLGLVQ